VTEEELEREVMIRVFRTSPGGQHVGTQLYPLEAVHLPTGIKIVIPGDVVRSQHGQR
jgi:protein subunit release factor A